MRKQISILSPLLKFAKSLDKSFQTLKKLKITLAEKISLSENIKLYIVIKIF